MTEIYKITCKVCNKLYIGKHHISEQSPNSYLGSGKKQLQHLKEHGTKNQIKQILLYCEDADTKYYEETIIKLYDATNIEIGLNVSKKSDGIHQHSENSKQKMSKSQKGRKHSEETKQKIREAKLGENNPMYGKKGSKHHNFGVSPSEETRKLWSEQRKGKYTGENNSMYGKKHSKESIEKNRQSHLGKSKPESQKSINVYIKKTAEYVRTFKSIKQAGIDLRLWHQNISKVCKGKLKSTGGYTFKYNYNIGI